MVWVLAFIIVLITTFDKTKRRESENQIFSKKKLIKYLLAVIQKVSICYQTYLQPPSLTPTIQYPSQHMLFHNKPGGGGFSCFQEEL